MLVQRYSRDYPCVIKHGRLNKNGWSVRKQSSRKSLDVTNVTFLVIAALFALPVGVLAQERSAEQGAFDITLSAGVVSAPAYRGGDTYQTSVVPNLTLKYKDRLSASLRGIKYAVISQGSWAAGPVLSYDFGREERTEDNPFAISSADSTDLIGLGDIDGTLQLGVFLEYEARSFAAKLELHQGIDGGHDGLFGEASISYRGQLLAVGRPTFYSIGPAMSFGDDAHNSTFFDISASQSAASGLSRFDAGGGISSIGLHGSILMPLSGATSLVGFVQYDQLAGDVADSSIVIERGSKDQLTTGFFLNYRF